jgi:hypothetical protein
MEMQIAEDLSSILGFVVLVIGLIVGWKAIGAKRRLWKTKSEKLAQYLKDAAKGSKSAERSSLEIMQDVGVTSDEAIRISFENPQIGRRADAGQINFFWKSQS